jgi:hypothetical protein
MRQIVRGGSADGVGGFAEGGLYANAMEGLGHSDDAGLGCAILFVALESEGAYG